MARTRIPLILLFALMAGIRLACLGSDPYLRLDWSAGLLTDEGFYIHNARNVALFGHPRTDGFNNMLVSPLLHYLQVGVFSIAGVGAIQARLISVVCGLLTLLLFYVALRRPFGAEVALAGTAFLGLDHVFALFNRMALMDTPAALLAVAAFCAFARATEERESKEPGECGGGQAGERDDRRLRIATDRSLPGPFLIPYSPAHLLLCGLFLGAAVLTRSLCAYLLPVPFIALWAAGRLRGRSGLREASLIAAPILAAALWYVLAWYLPNQAEIVHMNRYYALHQVRPHSLSQLGWNLYHGVLGDFRGITPYVFRHSPVIFGLALLGVGFGVQALRRSGDQGGGRSKVQSPGGVEEVVAASASKQPVTAEIAQRGETLRFASSDSGESHDHPVSPPPERLSARTPEGHVEVWPAQPFPDPPGHALAYLLAWLGLGVLTLSAISYSPGRYYVSLWPPLCALAAVALCRLPAIWLALWARNPGARLVRAGLAWLLAYHAVEALVHHGGILSSAATTALLYGGPTSAAIVIAVLGTRADDEMRLPDRIGEETKAALTGTCHSPLRRFTPSPVRAVIIALWLITNGIWLADWGIHIRYTQRELSRWLAADLPANSVLIGDVAPGICLDNRFVAVSVIPGLCNDDRPVERFAGRPRYVAILDRRWKEAYWRRQYPAVVADQRPMKLARVLRWDVGIYSVDGRQAD